MADIFKGVHNTMMNHPSDIRIGSYFVIVVSRIAEGGFGFVDLVSEVSTKKEYVLKRCNLRARDIIQTEISLLEKFRGPFIVDLIAHEMSGAEALLLLEYCPNGHLLQRLNDRSGSPLNLLGICTIFQQLLTAMQRLHLTTPPVVHRDLKLENILFASDNSIRLCDFGSCVNGEVSIKTPTERNNEEDRIIKTTTQMYRAPEMVDLYMRDVLTEKTDIWALGCIFYALVFLQHPFQDVGPLGILGGKLTISQTVLKSICVTSYPEAGDNIQKLLHQMLDIDPEARASVPQLLEATKCLSSGKPLPGIALTEEIVNRRETRQANEKLRMQQNTRKKPAVVVEPPRVVVPLDPNSVAAKRLAAKRRGVPSAPSSSSSAALPLPVPVAQATSDDFFSTESDCFSPPPPVTSTNIGSVCITGFADFSSSTTLSPNSSSFDSTLWGQSSDPSVGSSSSGFASTTQNDFESYSTTDSFGNTFDNTPAATAASADFFFNDLTSSVAATSSSSQSNMFDWTTPVNQSQGCAQSPAVDSAFATSFSEFSISPSPTQSSTSSTFDAFAMPSGPPSGTFSGSSAAGGGGGGGGGASFGAVFPCTSSGFSSDPFGSETLLPAKQIPPPMDNFSSFSSLAPSSSSVPNAQQFLGLTNSVQTPQGGPYSAQGSGVMPPFPVIAPRPVDPFAEVAMRPPPRAGGTGGQTFGSSTGPRDAFSTLNVFK